MVTSLMLITYTCSAALIDLRARFLLMNMHVLFLPVCLLAFQTLRNSYRVARSRESSLF